MVEESANRSGRCLAAAEAGAAATGETLPRWNLSDLYEGPEDASFRADLEAAPALPRFALLLVNPGVALETAAVFRQRSGAFTLARPWPERFETLEALIKELRGRANDLEETACGLRPEVLSCLGKLEGLPGCLLARMSGSGATCFGIFRDLKEAEAAAARITREQPHWWVEAAETDP